MLNTRRRRLALFVCVLAGQTLASAQTDERGVDTTGVGYQVGYQIGSWLPFIIIVLLALLVVVNSYRFSQRNKK